MTTDAQSDPAKATKQIKLTLDVTFDVHDSIDGVTEEFEKTAWSEALVMGLDAIKLRRLGIVAFTPGKRTLTFVSSRPIGTEGGK